MSKFLLLLTGKFSAVKAYLKRVIADGGTTSDPAHAQVVYDNTIGDEPTLIQSCDSGKATVLYNIEPTNADFTVDRNSTKYVLGSGGTIISYATDEPAFEFNADGSYKGLLVEPAATNICKQSEDLSTTWSPNANATVTANDTTAPDGNTTADKLGDDNPGGSPTPTGSVNVSQTITVSGGTKYTASAFLKKDGLNWAALVAAGTGGSPDSSPSQYFDLDTGALGTGTAGIQDATIEEYPNDWYRCSITWTQGAGDTSVPFTIYVADGDGDVTVDLDGTSSIFVWGAQVETGPIATSYIPTTTASVTRNVDNITQTSASSLIGQTEGTLYVEVYWQKAGTSQQILISINDSTASNRINFVSASNNFSFAESGISISESNNSYTGIQKFALAYATDNSAGFRNGSQVGTTDTTCTISSGKTDIDLGQSFAATGQANMWIRALVLYPTRLSDAECQALTTL